jgi:hypothetical protein
LVKEKKVAFLRLDGSIREDIVFDLDLDLTMNEVSGRTGLKGIFNVERALAIHIVEHWVIDKVDEKVIELLERAHLTLAIVFKVFSHLIKVKVTLDVALTIMKTL